MYEFLETFDTSFLLMLVAILVLTLFLPWPGVKR